MLNLFKSLKLYIEPGSAWYSIVFITFLSFTWWFVSHPIIYIRWHLLMLSITIQNRNFTTFNIRISSNSNTQIGAMINGSLVNTTSFEEYFPDLTWWERGVVFVWLLVMFLVSTIGNAFVLILSKDLKVGDYWLFQLVIRILMFLFNDIIVSHGSGRKRCNLYGTVINDEIY